MAAFLLNAALGLVQIGGGPKGFRLYIDPAAAPVWAPSVSDLLDSPTSTSLHRAERCFPARQTERLPQPAAAVPEQPVLIGTMMGGHGGFLAFGSLALPLGLAIVLHMLSPRGSRESLSFALEPQGQGSLIVLLLILLVLSAFLVGMMAGPWFCAAFHSAGVAVVGLPSALARAAGRWASRRCS